MSQPPLPGATGDAALRPPVPPQVTRAGQALYALAALQTLGLVLSLFMTDSAELSIRQSQPDATDSEVATLVTLGLVASTVVGVVIAGLWVLCARKILSGRGWARILATVLAGLVIFFDVLYLISSVVGDGSGFYSTVVTIVGLGLAGGYLFLIWSRPSNEFFAAAGPR